MDGMKDHPPISETIATFLVLAMIGAQTWMVVNEATGGDAGRRLSQWWASVARPAIVRAVIWIDARAITEQMVTDEIHPYLEESRGY